VVKRSLKTESKSWEKILISTFCSSGLFSAMFEPLLKYFYKESIQNLTKIMRFKKTSNWVLGSDG
jgi:hypothetical protein